VIFLEPRLFIPSTRLLILVTFMSTFLTPMSTFLTLMSTSVPRLLVFDPSMSSETTAFDVLDPRLFKKHQSMAQNIKCDGSE
jgi:hypothetical protein